MSARDFMPIIRDDSFKLPWHMIALHERQAYKNHTQSLEQLADRGGLGYAEAVAIMRDIRWLDLPMTIRESTEQARAALVQLIEERAQWKYLKTDSPTFRASAQLVKMYEIRLNDRDFKVGDQLLLCETLHTGEQMRRGMPLLYSGATLRRKVTHVLEGYGLQDNWIIMAVVPI